MLSSYLPPVAEASVSAETASVIVVVPLLLSCSSAVRTPLWFIVESLLFIKSLLAFSESEFCIAIFAS